MGSILRSMRSGRVRMPRRSAA